MGTMTAITPGCSGRPRIQKDANRKTLPGLPDLDPWEHQDIEDVSFFESTYMKSTGTHPFGGPF